VNIPDMNEREIAIHGVYILLIIVILFVPIPWFLVRFAIALGALLLLCLVVVLALRKKRK